VFFQFFHSKFPDVFGKNWQNWRFSRFCAILVAFLDFLWFLGHFPIIFYFLGS
jgi:hypothetical protein